MDCLQQLLIPRLVITIQLAVLDAEAVAPEDEAALRRLKLLLIVLVVIIVECTRHTLRGTGSSTSGSGGSVLRSQCVTGATEGTGGRS